MLAGKNVSVAPYINSLRHGVSGSSTTKDLETALQLTYLYFADPRFDQAEFDQAIKKLQSIVPNYVKQPSYKFSKELQSTLYGENPRKTLITEKTLEEASLATIEKDYRMLFHDAAGATAIFCGDFDIDTVLPLIQKYLGSINKGKRPFKCKYEKPAILSGKVTNDFKTDMLFSRYISTPSRLLRTSS